MQKNIIISGIISIGLLLGLILGLNSLTTAVPINADMLEAANNLYVAGHYGEAAQLYEQLAAQGVEDSALFYNLGNAYYQSGDSQQAALQYVRAAQLAPRDADIAANLELVGYAPTSNSPFERLLNMMTLNETAVFTLSVWFLFTILLLVYIQLNPGQGRNAVGYAIAAIFIVLLIGGALLGGQIMAANVNGNVLAFGAAA